jgi:hypothetical protein
VELRFQGLGYRGKSVLNGDRVSVWDHESSGDGWDGADCTTT